MVLSGITLLISSLIVGRISDLRYRKFKANHDGQAPPPERRIDIQIWGYLIAAVGKIMFGWFVLNELHPAAALAASGIGKRKLTEKGYIHADVEQLLLVRG